MKVEPARRTEQFGGRAWLDYWDSVTVTTTQLFVAEIVARCRVIAEPDLRWRRTL